MEHRVALCLESVDWNLPQMILSRLQRVRVALCLESVDWNIVWNIEWCMWRWRSLSAWRAWIEIVKRWTSSLKKTDCRSLLGERGLKFSCRWCYRYFWSSLSAWRAWIEIKIIFKTKTAWCVALCLESVDWNLHGVLALAYVFRVALCLESVDWNTCGVFFGVFIMVALCLESVDWNWIWYSRF